MNRSNTNRSCHSLDRLPAIQSSWSPTHDWATDCRHPAIEIPRRSASAWLAGHHCLRASLPPTSRRFLSSSQSISLSLLLSTFDEMPSSACSSTTNWTEKSWFVLHLVSSCLNSDWLLKQNAKSNYGLVSIRDRLSNSDRFFGVSARITADTDWYDHFSNETSGDKNLSSDRGSAASAKKLPRTQSPKTVARLRVVWIQTAVIKWSWLVA